MDRQLRPATPQDAAAIVALMDMASHGMARALWAALTPPGQDPDAFAVARAQREKGGFSYRNTRILVANGETAGMLMSWPIPPEPLPTDDLPATAIPLQELENLAPRGALYINGLALFPAFRRKGLARWMLGQAGQGPQDQTQALITGSSNASAITLYHAAGFTERARRPAVGDALWQPPFADWILLTRP
jgi:ribosomal protein S18 acetylase RimI-like enzyme